MVKVLQMSIRMIMERKKNSQEFGVESRRTLDYEL